MTSKNLYHKRLVAENAAKACWICYKPSSTVLITPESDDWFYICPTHLTDHNFAIAQDAVDLEKQKRDQELEMEIEAVKKEHEEKMKRKKAKKKGDKEDTKAADNEQNDNKTDVNEEKVKNDQLKALEEKKASSNDGPRIFSLTRSFYQQRLHKKQLAMQAKRNLERLQDPSSLPSPPSGFP